VIICDTGALLALLNAADDAHAACDSVFSTYPGRLTVPGPILTEVCLLGLYQGVSAHQPHIGPAVSHASSALTSEPECFLDLGKARLLVNGST
jgi:predicted nucleic acid-binding protein